MQHVPADWPADLFLRAVQRPQADAAVRRLGARSDLLHDLRGFPVGQVHELHLGGLQQVGALQDAGLQGPIERAVGA
eukprot:2553518-Lingulodinium_polyedra.AAC.1